MRYEPDRCRLHELYGTTGITQRMVHVITGIPESQLSDYANNRTKMGFATSVTISKAFNLPTPELLYTWRKIKVVVKESKGG